MRIIDLRGASCSGKTYVRETFNDLDNHATFDILDFYKKHEVIVNDKMDWDMWHMFSPKIAPTVVNFLEECDEKNLIPIIEHTNNEAISSVLARPEYKSRVTSIRLITPEFDELKSRAEKRKMDYKKVISFASSYKRKMIGPEMLEHSVQQAISIVSDILNPSPIIYRVGSALVPFEPSGRPSIICHVCNDIGAWGSGFVIAINSKWAEPERAYLEWFRSGQNFELGMVQLVMVEQKIMVANMIAQHETINTVPGSVPIRYNALEEALDKVSQRAIYLGASVHMPRIGCARAGGKWDEVAKIIDKTLTSKGISTSVYTLPGDTSWK